MSKFSLFPLAVLLLLSACSKEAAPQRDAGSSEFQKELQMKFINTRRGDVIEIPEGFYELSRGLSLNVSGIEIENSFDADVYGNRFSGGGSSPDGLDLKVLKVAMSGLTGSFPDIVWDGYVNPDSLGCYSLRSEYTALHRLRT